MNERRITLLSVLLILVTMGIVYFIASVIGSNQKDPTQKGGSSSSIVSFSSVSFSQESSSVSSSSVSSGATSSRRPLIGEEVVKKFGLVYNQTKQGSGFTAYQVGLLNDFSDIERKTKASFGTLKVLTDKEIASYNLPGKSVAFVNIPDYKQSWVVMVVFDTALWIVVIQKDAYQTIKPQLHTLFSK